MTSSPSERKIKSGADTGVGEQRTGKRGLPAVKSDGEKRAAGKGRRATQRGRWAEDAERERIPEALSFNQIHYTEFIAARELIKCRRINSRRSKAECLHEI